MFHTWCDNNIALAFGYINMSADGRLQRVETSKHSTHLTSVETKQDAECMTLAALSCDRKD
jgi:hypothetical protein